MGNRSKGIIFRRCIWGRANAQSKHTTDAAIVLCRTMLYDVCTTSGLFSIIFPSALNSSYPCIQNHRWGDDVTMIITILIKENYEKRKMKKGKMLEKNDRCAVLETRITDVGKRQAAVEEYASNEPCSRVRRCSQRFAFFIIFFYSSTCRFKKVDQKCHPLPLPSVDAGAGCAIIITRLVHAPVFGFYFPLQPDCCLHTAVNICRK